MNIKNNPYPDEKPEKATPPKPSEPIEPEKNEKDLPSEAYPTSSESFIHSFKPQSPYEKYINESDDNWE